METFTNPYTNDTIVLQQRVHNPNLWEMHQNGEWIGAADYHDLLVAKLERNGFVAESAPEPTIARASVEINRVHPDARDISVSSRGHERTISNYWKQGATFHEINAWIASVAPEVNVNGAPSYANDPDQYSACYFLPSAKDRRGYSTYTYIRLYFAPVEEVLTLAAD